MLAHRLVKELHPFAGMQHLDMAGGTGDVAFRVLDAISAADAESLAISPTSSAFRPGSVTVGDINPAMLMEGKKRAAQLGLGKHHFPCMHAHRINDIRAHDGRVLRVPTYKPFGTR